jgi:hypothetical protein
MNLRYDMDFTNIHDVTRDLIWLTKIHAEYRVLLGSTDYAEV